MFDWNDEKAALNLEKHEVSFEEARTVLMTRFIWGFLIQDIRTMNIVLLL